MSFGSERLVSVRNNPNIRRSFDAVRAGFRKDGLAVDAFFAVPLELKPGVIDRDDEGQRFWGIYSVLDQPLFRSGPNLDLYYLGLDRANSDYAQAIADEHRHSLGVRAWSKRLPWDYNFEAVYQFGTFGQGGISAWTVASDSGYRWSELPLKPRLALKADVISGDPGPGRSYPGDLTTGSRSATAPCRSGSRPACIHRARRPLVITSRRNRQPRPPDDETRPFIRIRRTRALEFYCAAPKSLERRPVMIDSIVKAIDGVPE